MTLFFKVIFLILQLPAICLSPGSAVSGSRAMQMAECVLSGALKGTIHLQSTNNDRVK